MRPTQAQTLAFARHVITYAGGVVTTLAAFHLIKDSDASTLTHALNQIGDGLTNILAGVATLVSVISGLCASFSASPFRQLVAVSKNPDVSKVIVKDPQVAQAVPSDKVTTN